MSVQVISLLLFPRALASFLWKRVNAGTLSDFRAWLARNESYRL